MIFLRVVPKVFLWPHYSGAPGARGPRFIEPPEPPVPTPVDKAKKSKDNMTDRSGDPYSNSMMATADSEYDKMEIYCSQHNSGDRCVLRNPPKHTHIKRHQ